MNLWKRKLLAYLHDPPSKCLDLGGHTANAATLMRQAGFTEEEVNQYSRVADHTASAADRFPFPHHQASGLRCHFDGVRNQFHHPLGGSALKFGTEFKSAEAAFETDQTIQPVIQCPADWGEDKTWRARFFAHWRLYAQHAIERDWRFGFLPADTRIPDHTVWTHMQVVSALAGCAESDDPRAPLAPAFIKFQIGPVQEFIAQARSIRDLWSGSYLLSWLVASGLKALTAVVGPDAVIYPGLRGQPIFDLLWRDELWSKIQIGDRNIWDSGTMGWDNAKLLTPNLPNVFLAVVPAVRSKELGQQIATAIQAEWKSIADKVWEKCDRVGLILENEAGLSKVERHARFKNQVERFLAISWQATPWPDTVEKAVKMTEDLAPSMPAAVARKRLEEIARTAQETMPQDHRDRRYYTDDKKDKLNNIGLGWSVILAMNAWELDAVRQTRFFKAWCSGGWDVGLLNNKDSLNGRDEAVAGGRTWGEAAKKVGPPWENLFKHEDWLGAATLIKRTWHIALLDEQWGLKTSGGQFPMPNTRGIAAHKPFDDCDEETADAAPDDEKYFAVLALDGDSIGKWVSGANTPEFGDQLADYTDGSGKERLGAKPYFEKQATNLLKTRRPLSPSYHLQFSEALSNFALRCAKPVVETFGGRLIYAGGDDVVALVPADTSLACAQALRTAFKGLAVKRPDGRELLNSLSPGFLATDDWKDDHGRGRPIPFLVPGPAADCSVGIAIAHFKSPLQDVVREAQAAEKRAKRAVEKGGLGRSAVAVTLMKRSGEIVEWGCKWNSGGLALFEAILKALVKEKLTAKLPHRVIEFLSPYVLEQTGLAKATASQNFASNADDIILRDFGVALERQSTRKLGEEERTELARLLKEYLDNAVNGSSTSEKTVETKLKALIGLCQVVAFASRTSDGQTKTTAERQTA